MLSPWNHILDKEPVRRSYVNDKMLINLLFQGVVMIFAFTSLTLYENAFNFVRQLFVLILKVTLNKCYSFTAGVK